MNSEGVTDCVLLRETKEYLCDRNEVGVCLILGGECARGISLYKE